MPHLLTGCCLHFTHTSTKAPQDDGFRPDPWLPAIDVGLSSPYTCSSIRQSPLLSEIPVMIQVRKALTVTTAPGTRL